MDFISDEEMAKMGGNQEPPSDFISDNEMKTLEEKKQRDPTSSLESIVRGRVQGLSFNHADEITGALESAAGSLGLVPDKTYEEARDESRANYDFAEKSHPYLYNANSLIGNVGTSLIPGVAPLKGAGMLPAAARVAQNIGLGALGGEGASNAQDASGVLKDAGIGAMFGAAGSVASEAAPAVAKFLASKGDAAKKIANDLYVKATGATGKQLEKFADDAGEYLGKNKLVRFFDSPEKIAERVQAKVDSSGKEIGDMLADLDSKGVTASVDKVVESLQSKIGTLKQVPGNETLIKRLQNEVNNLIGRGQSDLPVSVAEQAKRNYQGQTNYFSPKSDQQASKSLGSAFRQEVEDVVTKYNPELAKKFLDEKKAIQTLKPIEEAAIKRANQLNQSPFGGLGDMASAAVGGSLGSPHQALNMATGIAGRRIIAPRLSSSMAVSFDKLGDMLKAAPQAFGKYGQVLQNAAARGGSSLGATNFVLMNTDPEYRKMLMDLSEQE